VEEKKVPVRLMGADGYTEVVVGTVVEGGIEFTTPDGMVHRVQVSLSPGDQLNVALAGSYNGGERVMEPNPTTLPGGGAQIYGIDIKNPTAVWHVLKNSRAYLGKNGEAWLSGGWYANGSMCLANVLRHVTHGYASKPRAQDHEYHDMAERLVTAHVRSRYMAGSIPTFNDGRTQSREGFKAIVEVLDDVADMVKPFAFTHSVTIASEVMSEREKKAMDEAVWKDLTKAFRSSRGARRRLSQVETSFANWLDDHEKRGWTGFWEELADCDTPECEEARKELLGV